MSLENYWKCRVFKISRYRWAAIVIETDIIVVRCGTWARAVKQAIKFKAVQHRTNGRGWSMSKELEVINAKNWAKYEKEET
jgi:hypothetical protein